MASQGLLLCVLLISIHGETVTISCTASASTIYLHWYQQKPGQQPKLLIYKATSRYTGVPGRFTGFRSEANYTLTIREVTEDDAADYYCQQTGWTPLTQ
ncbi:hypothetical protein GDO81_026802 [Engystomops pustulosus]|uniref:Ig-like domain-containing protein n=1 Tax=Engystomops pustulosus TaxID=76066 RepID=A0AAV6Z8Y2_ENGPU|nr:hypothetical protein GDO81_026802 [Engystomops pustulosus]